MAHRVAPTAELDLDDIWHRVAKESQSIEVADRLIEAITNRFFLLASFPHLGRSRIVDLGVGSRSFVFGGYVIVYAGEGDDVIILRVAHGRRDVAALFLH